MRLWRVSGGKRRNPLEALVADLKAQLEANMAKAAKVLSAPTAKTASLAAWLAERPSNLIASLTQACVRHRACVPVSPQRAGRLP